MLAFCLVGSVSNWCVSFGDSVSWLRESHRPMDDTTCSEDNLEPLALRLSAVELDYKRCTKLWPYLMASANIGIGDTQRVCVKLLTPRWPKSARQIS